MLRRMATVVAATTALALAGAVPALADHDEVVDPLLVEDNPTCEDVAALFDDLEGVEELDRVEFKDDQPTTVTVDPADFPGFEIFVIVKGGPDANVYFSNFTDMTAPEVPGGTADVSHYTVCGVKAMQTTSPPPPPPDGNGNGDDDDDNGDGDGDDKETPKPTVPTEVPAGYGQADNGSASTIGLLAFVTALAVGGAALVTRRFLKDN
jgi:hypothetical protein